MRDLRSELIGLRLASISGGCLSVLRAASVLGREFDVSVLESMAVAPSRLERLLAEARTAGFTEAVDAPPGRFRFVHELIRDRIYEEMPGRLRRRLHWSAGEALEEALGGPAASLSQLAHHFCAGTAEGGLEKAIRYAVAAGDQALAVLAFEEAERLYAMALGALRGATGVDPDPPSHS